MIDNNPKDDMSMEDILASIRKYVADDDVKQSQEQTEQEVSMHENFSTGSPIIKLNESQIIDNDNSDQPQKTQESDENPVTYSEVGTLSMNTVAPHSESGNENPFNKLTNALNSYGKNKEEKRKNLSNTMTIDKFLESIATPVIEKWVQNNISRIVEEAVDKEIQKLKNNN